MRIYFNVVDYRLHRNKNIMFYVFAGKTRAMEVYCVVKLAVNILVEEEKNDKLLANYVGR